MIGSKEGKGGGKVDDSEDSEGNKVGWISSCNDGSLIGPFSKVGCSGT